MANPIILDNLSDEEVMALGPDAIDTLQTQENEGETSDDTPTSEGADDSKSNPESPKTSEPEDVSQEEDDTKKTEENSEDDEDKDEINKETDDKDSYESDDDSSKDDDEKSSKEKIPDTEEVKDKTPDSDDDGSKEKDKAIDPDKYKGKEKKTPDTATKAKNDVAMDFYSKVTAVIKADGKDIKIRSPEDAIRLIQMGVNYSRRMQEMKPIRAQNAMLIANGLDTPEKLNELIDLASGNKNAIQKFLKAKGIDPLDLDTSKSDEYKTPDFQADPKDIAFQEAIDNTLAAEGGKELLQDVNATWDINSKEALRDEPQIFQNLLDQKDSGVYEKIKTELEYQRTMGFLVDVPFLQAYHQVGDAMQKAGVFGLKEVQSVPTKVAIDTGTRKAAKPKTEQPNQNLSSIAPPRNIAINDSNVQNEPDYSSMSDEEMMKLAPPT